LEEKREVSMFRIFIIVISIALIAGCRVGDKSSSYSSLFDSSDSSKPSASFSSFNSNSGSSSSDLPVYPNPEPSTLILLGLGLASFALTKLRRKP